MIFTLSNAIGLERKILYIGLILVVCSVLFISMINFADGARVVFLSWISVLAVLGISLLVIASTQGHARALYLRWGWISLVATALFVPLLVSVLLYLASIFASFEEMGERFIVNNSARIVAVTAPLLLIVEIALLRMRRTEIT